MKGIIINWRSAEVLTGLNNPWMGGSCLILFPVCSCPGHWVVIDENGKSSLVLSELNIALDATVNNARSCSGHIVRAADPVFPLHSDRLI